VRSLFVRKMRGTATDLSEYAFEIVQGRGIVIRQPI
jgi:KaiC/GvpD/RAD55 family RecA-like ATPase